jgi:hypothetical protein
MRAVLLAVVVGLSLRTTSAAAQGGDPPHARNWVIPTLHGGGQLLLQRVGLSVLYGSAFTLDDPARAADSFARAWTTPPVFDPSRRVFEWDRDIFYLNVFGHGLMGSELYLRARQCGHGFLPSLLFTTGMSVAWEYVIEAWHAQPSAIDLVWTPLGGALIGEFRFAAWELAGTLPPTARRVVRAIVDPFGELERAAGSEC